MSAIALKVLIVAILLPVACSQDSVEDRRSTSNSVEKKPTTPPTATKTATPTKTETKTENAEPVLAANGFVKKIFPLLQKQCANCHIQATATIWGIDDKDLFGTFTKTPKRYITKPSEGDPEKSKLLTKVSGAEGHAGGALWPKESEQFKAVIEWITTGKAAR